MREVAAAVGDEQGSGHDRMLEPLPGPTRKEAPVVDVAVCVATHQRPEGLGDLLESLSAQAIPPGVEFRVVVVENEAVPDPRVARVVERSDLPVELVLEPRPGIAHARNTGVTRCTPADFIAFIDDDEVAPPHWLATHLSAMDQYAADVTTGPVLPRFVAEPPGWAIPSGLFDRRRWRTGHHRREAYTGNTLCATHLLVGSEGPFDVRLATTGGEDTELFRRLTRAGARIVWVDEAPVMESIPPDRVTVLWVLRRGFRIGGDRWRRRAAQRPIPMRRAAAAVLGTTEAFIGLVAAVVAVPFSRGRAVRYLNRAARGAGLVCSAAGLDYHEYR